MKKTLAGALFVALGAAATGAGALDNLALQGSDTLKPLTIAVLAACPAAAGTTYPGGGSGAGEGALKNGTQTVAPMSRFLAAANTCAFAPDATEAEALQVGLDALSIVVSSKHRTTCDPDNPPAGQACKADVATGIRFSDTAPSAALACGMAVNDWKAVLRLIYFGLRPLDIGACKIDTATHCTSNTQCPGAGDSCVVGSQIKLNARDCNDACRVEVVENWGKLFQNACSGGDCTKLQHAFRRDENSGTTDAFRDLLNVRDLAAAPPIADGNTGFPFCNEYEPAAGDVAPACPPALAGTGVPGSPGFPARPYFELFQDSDPIRRPAIGNGNLNLDLKTPPAVAPTEQVASAKGNLGLVLPISVPPLTASITDAERHVRIGTVTRGADQVPTQYCTRGFFKNASAPSISAVAPASAVCAAGPAFGLCPNGDIPKGGCWDETLKIVIGGSGVCPYPVFDADGSVATTNDQDFRCINGANNRPSFSSGVNQMAAATKAACVSTAFDGRVYNLHPHLNNGQYITQAYTYTGGIAGVPATGARPVVGAFYRMHETRTAVTGFAGCVGDNCCSLNDSTDQIGCLVGANPCSIGFAGENANNQEVATVADGTTTATPRTVFGASLNGIEPAKECVLANSYPFSRFLWLSTMTGYRTGGVSGDELELAKCYSGNGLNNGLTIQQMVRNEGFQDIPVGCRSFNESDPACNDGGPTNSCTNNPAGVATLAAIGEACAANADCASNVCDPGTSKCKL
jgi:ABC-type phosphate transport system substrate-binding protein